MRAPLAVAALLISLPAAAQIVSVKLQPPERDFGYSVGDVLTSDAVIVVGPGTVLDTNSLPYASPVTPSIDLRRVTVSDAAAAEGGRRIAIRTEYQTFETPDEVSRIEVPGYELVFSGAGKRVPVNVPGFGFSVSPFRHDIQAAVDPALIKPDHPVAFIDMTVPRMRFFAALAAAAASLFWLLAMQNWLPWRRQGDKPFARAAARIRRAGEAPEAWRILHRAFDETAGMRLFSGDIETFLSRHTRFASYRSDIESFFAASHETFFTPGSGTTVVPPRHLENLCRRLAKAERR
jgi:mxaA protein